ncbi:MAG: hypothetical protein B7Z80_23810 [Rhodospirillales bacterium 20-64-7]|nr:MAG: hypothetical protein B7Z80_23810 [Rhodospirillales bacterium 20-64-7]
MLEAEPGFRVLVEGLVPGLPKVGRFEGDRFVAINLGELDPAIPVLVLDIPTAEDGETFL